MLHADEIAAWLRDHPDFLVKYPDILAAQLGVPLAGHEGGNVASFQTHAMARIRQHLDAQQEALADLVVLSRDHFSQLEQLHHLVLAMIRCESWDDLMDMLASRMLVDLMLDAAVIAVEADTRPATMPELPESILHTVPVGTVEAYLGSGGLSRIDAMPPADDGIFCAATGLVQSAAYLWLELPGRAAMLAIGSRDEYRFHPTHTASLWRFFARVLERMLAHHWPA